MLAGGSAVFAKDVRKIAFDDEENMELRDMHKREDEEEKEYAINFRNVVTRCGNVHSRY